MSEQDPVDLSALTNLSFGPDWSTGPKRGGLKREPRRDDRSDGRRPEGRRPDSRRPDSRRPAPGGEGRDRRQGGGAPQRSPQRQQRIEVFRPNFRADFYPEDEPFVVLSRAMRSSCNTYELFDIAKLILEKPERFVVVVAPMGKEGEKKLYAAGTNNLPFETEQEALAFALKNDLANFFDMEEVDVEPPKGAFNQVNKCGFTGKLLGPPNYHRYQDALKEHYMNNVSHVPFDAFTAKIQAVKDEDQIKAWVDSMSKAIRYKVKDAPIGEEPKAFDTWEAARAYLLSTHKEHLVRAYDHVRFSGTLIDELPDGDIKRSIKTLLERQREFPLDTANNLRGRLRRMKFAIYKKGSAGVTYVCAIKRKIRQEGQEMAGNLANLIDFIEKNTKISHKDLANKYLGFASADAEESAAPELTDEQKAQAKQVMLDLRWLVSEGYVTEYADGTLFAPAPLPAPKLIKAAEPKLITKAEEPKEIEAPAPVKLITKAEEPKELEAPEAVEVSEDAVTEPKEPRA